MPKVPLIMHQRDCLLPRWGETRVNYQAEAEDHGPKTWMLSALLLIVSEAYRDNSHEDSAMYESSWMHVRDCLGFGHRVLGLTHGH